MFTMVDHGARDHATWSASATARNWHCAGALTLSQFAPEGKESIHAARGTAAHQIAEKCLRGDKDAIDFLGTVEKTKSFEIEIDEEIANSAQEYIDYCRERLTYCRERLTFGDDAVKWWLEEKFSLTDLDPPFEAGGTGDFVAFYPSGRQLEIVDLKHGMGVVDVNENKQLRTYGLGALLKHPELDVETVKVTIVQPRAPHKDGRIRSETFHVADLIGWTSELLDAMGRSKQAMDAYDACNGNSILLDEWADRYLTPGKCTFCPVEGNCPKLRKEALEKAAVFFEPDTGEAKIGNSALDTSPEALARDLDAFDMIEAWIKARRAYAHQQAENGVEIPGYQLAEKIGNRKWSEDEKTLAKLLSGDEDAWRAKIENSNIVDDEKSDVLKDMIAQYDVDERAMFVDPKLKSPAQMEKMLGAKRKALIEPFVTREVTGNNLVAIGKTSRPPAKPKAANFIETE